MRDRLLKQIAPLARKLGEDLVALLVPQFEHVRDRVVEDAKARLRAELEAVAAPKAAPKRARAKPKKKITARDSKRRTPSKPPSTSSARKRVPRERSAAPDSAPPQGIEATPTTAKRPACRICGESGHNARSCGREPKGGSHGARPTAAPARAARVSVDPPPPRLSSVERGALDKPCRDPNCRIVKLHAAHGETP